MDLLTIFGFIAGIIVLLLGITENGSLNAFYDIGSIYITVGGTLFALVMTFPWKNLKNVMPAIKKAFFTKTSDPVKTIDTIFDLAEQARKGGMLSLEEKAIALQDKFIIRAVSAIVDSHDPQKVRDTLEMEMDLIQERHGAVQGIFLKGASYGPAFGMIGTLIGLINMLGRLENPDSIGADMAVALVTTFYGSVLANVFFIPLAGKLKALDDEEMFIKQLVVEGILAIQMGENPRLIKEKLLSLLPQNMKKQKRKRKDNKVIRPKVKGNRKSVDREYLHRS